MLARGACRKECVPIATSTWATWLMESARNAAKDVGVPSIQPLPTTIARGTSRNGVKPMKPTGAKGNGRVIVVPVPEKCKTSAVYRAMQEQSKRIRALSTEAQPKGKS